MKLKGQIHKADSKKIKLMGCLLKGSSVALCCSLLLVLVFAFLLKFTNIPDSAIAPINQVVKGVSVFLGVFIGLKRIKELGLLSGLLIGLIYTMLAFFVFSLLAGSLSFDLTFLFDLLFGGLIGAVCGIICINLKKSSN